MVSFMSLFYHFPVSSAISIAVIDNMIASTVIGDMIASTVIGNMIADWQTAACISQICNGRVPTDKFLLCRATGFDIIRRNKENRKC